MDVRPVKLPENHTRVDVAAPPEPSNRFRSLVARGLRPAPYTTTPQSKLLKCILTKIDFLGSSICSIM